MRSTKTGEIQHTKLLDKVLQLNQEFMDVVIAAVLPQWVALDLTFSQLKALILIKHHSALTISELARLLGTGKPATSILVHQLVQSSLVKRTEDQQDRRRTVLRVTPKGVDLLVGQREHTHQYMTRWFSQLANGDLACYSRGLDALIRVVRSEQAQKDKESGHVRGKASKISTPSMEG